MNKIKPELNHEDIEVFRHETKIIDGDLWVRLACVVKCNCGECEKKHECRLES